MSAMKALVFLGSATKASEERAKPQIAAPTNGTVKITKTTIYGTGSGHAIEDQDFLDRVAESVAQAGAVLITGPANAKTELVKHIHHHDPELIDIIAGVESVDHPSDGALVAHAKHYFQAADLMQPQLR
jgi:stalled ribosome rescue protein Dom34